MKRTLCAAGLGAAALFAALLALEAFVDRRVCEVAEELAAGERDQAGKLCRLKFMLVRELLNGEGSLSLVAAWVA